MIYIDSRCDQSGNTLIVSGHNEERLHPPDSICIDEVCPVSPITGKPASAPMIFALTQVLDGQIAITPPIVVFGPYKNVNQEPRIGAFVRRWPTDKWVAPKITEDYPGIDQAAIRAFDTKLGLTYQQWHFFKQLKVLLEWNLRLSIGPLPSSFYTTLAEGIKLYDQDRTRMMTYMEEQLREQAMLRPPPAIIMCAECPRLKHPEADGSQAAVQV